MWQQLQITLPPFTRGCHLITEYVLDACPVINKIETGILHVFIQHTSASLMINENADPDVLVDMNMALNRMVPESWPWIHTCEGPDDMPAHVKAAVTQTSLSVPISDGRLLTGTWQGIYLCEHRDSGGARRLVLTVYGQTSHA